MELVWVLGDQLNQDTNLLRDIGKDDLVFFIESFPFANQHKHHKKKLIFQFSAMRHFAEDLKKQKIKVRYIHFYDEIGKNHDFEDALKIVLKEEKVNKLRMMKTADFDCSELQKSLKKQIKNIEVEIVLNDLFISTEEDIKKQLPSNKKSYLMESYYRYLRKKHKILMEGEKPVGGSWNYDKENRKPLGRINTHQITHQANTHTNLDGITQKVIEQVEEHFPSHYGVSDNFQYSVNRKQALSCLNSFIENSLSKFGDYQDAMNTEHNYLYHSLLSYLINFGLLHPLEVIRAIEQAHYSNSKLYPINSVEGFIRQILGWREFIRAIYLTQMPKSPSYRELNFFDSQRSLPEFFWSANTEMSCLQHSIKQTIETAYAHHIQRLMVIGNFSLLAGLNPQEVCEWYLIVYVDALEWVELPNTLGMSQFADGGLFATKPYISSGKYIDKMSNYCKSCKFNVKESLSDGACPFNYLYWNFLDDKKSYLQSNHRMGIAMKNLKNKNSEDMKIIKKKSKEFLESL